jgi:two-component system, chemotaxis family, protein-glutamate methylesterase/glutaminase
MDRDVPTVCAGRGAAYFDAVAIGSSAGGLAALGAVVERLPAELPAAVLIVQHMERHRPSSDASMLGRHASLPIREAADEDVICAGTVYIAPPNLHLLVRDGRLVLASTAAVHFSRPSVDRLFESVADTYDGRAIGVILSGNGADGADGLRAIKAHGGVTIAQDPSTAAHGDMPRAAVDTGCVDYTLELAAIGPAISRLVLQGRDRRHDWRGRQ